RRFFEELDRDGDGQVTLEDLEVEMRKRKLPRRYAKEFMSLARSHLFSRSFGMKQFLSLMEQKEPTILRAYTSLCLSKSGTLKKMRRESVRILDISIYRMTSNLCEIFTFLGKTITLKVDNSDTIYKVK
ncbi:unnamed protein product, partial [Sphenostylis stenocarpa]